MHSEISIDVSAPPRTVFDLARDISSWPRMLPHYRKVTIRSRNEGQLTADDARRAPVRPARVACWLAERRNGPTIRTPTTCSSDSSTWAAPPAGWT